MGSEIPANNSGTFPKLGWGAILPDRVTPLQIECVHVTVRRVALIVCVILIRIHISTTYVYTNFVHYMLSNFTIRYDLKCIFD